MTSRSIFAISTIIDNYCNKLNLHENQSDTSKSDNQTWITPKYIDNVSYRFVCVKYPHGENKMQMEYYFHNQDDENVIYSLLIEDANQLREFLENKILKY